MLARYQAYLFFPMLLLEAASMHAISVRAVLNGPVRRRWLEGLLLFAHCAGFLAAVFLVLSWPRAPAFIAIQQELFGLYQGCAFAPNHKGMPVLSEEDSLDFPPPAGAHLTQRQRRPPDRDHARRPQLPDRAPPVPGHAPPGAAPLPDGGARLLRSGRPLYCEKGLVSSYSEVLRHAAGR